MRIIFSKAKQLEEMTAVEINKPQQAAKLKTLAALDYCAQQIGKSEIKILKTKKHENENK